MSTARERRAKRIRKQAMVSRPVAAQVDSRPRPRRSSRDAKLPAIPPIVRLALLLPPALGLIVVVVLALGALNPPAEGPAPNAIWLNPSWTHAARSEDELLTLGQRLRDAQIGTIYAYVSSLKLDGTWSGEPEQRNRFVEVEPLVHDFVQQARQIMPNGRVFAWLEVYADPPTGYRLDNLQIQRIVADFSARVIRDFGFDGVLLDVKPIFDGNADLLNLLRTVRGAVGLQVPLAVSVPPDFTPSELSLRLAEPIAPNTVWSAEYKQRVSLQADYLVVVAHNSYITDADDYAAWVSYQVRAFASALSGINNATRLLISVPHYPPDPPAHDPSIESLANALRGASAGLGQLSEGQRALMQGVAIYADSDLGEADWDAMRRLWVRRE